MRPNYFTFFSPAGLLLSLISNDKAKAADTNIVKAKKEQLERGFRDKVKVYWEFRELTDEQISRL